MTRQTPPWLLPSLLLLAPLVGAQQEGEQVPPKANTAPIATSPTDSLLAAAKTRAAVHNKRVLVIGCPAGVDLLATLKKVRAVSRGLQYEFEAVQIVADAGGEMAKKWLADDGTAALTILTNDGKELGRMSAATFVEGGTVRAEELMAAWKPHFCPPVDAQQKLTDAMAAAKKSGRKILVRFDAPW
ncbi:MAG: hypothetical protein AB8H80_05400 [Planctomycetota bacterium]